MDQADELAKKQSSLETLNERLAHLPPVLLKVPFRLHQLFGSLLRARRRVDQRLHALLHLAERLGLLIHRFHALGHGVELAGGCRGLGFSEPSRRDK